jgi:pimeloyl-ACP methyl ester carboxylesterase
MQRFPSRELALVRRAAMKPTAMDPRSPFTTTKLETEYFAAYQASLRRWPVPYEELDLESRFGRTHVIASGPRDAPPLVLVHGYGASSTMWALNVGELARQYRVLAVDVIGQAGKSRTRAPLATRDECEGWLASILDGLGIDRARLVGMSYGGWLVLDFAIAAPERVRAVAALSPGGLLALSPQLRWRAMLAALVPWQRVSDLVLMRWISARQGRADAEQRVMAKLMARQMFLGLRVRRELVMSGAPADPFSDDELRSLRVPTLLLIGEQEVLYPPAAALEHARRLIPGLVGELIPGASHDLPSRRPDLVDARLLTFFATADATVDDDPRPSATGC